MSEHRAGRATTAEPFYRQVLQQAGEQPVALNLLGLVCLQTGRNQEAADLLLRATQANKDYAEAFGNLGTALLRLGRLEEAVRVIERLVELKPKVAEAHNQLGMAYRASGDYSRARGCYERALQLQPDFLPSRDNLITMAQEQQEMERLYQTVRSDYQAGRTAAAEQNCRLLLQRFPRHAGGLNTMGLLIYQQGQQEAARDYFRRAVAAQPDHADAHNNLGALYRAQGDPAAARQSFEQACRYQPENVDAAANRAYLLLEQGDTAGADHCLLQLLAKKADALPVYNQFGRRLADLGHAEASRKVFTRVVQAQPEFLEGYRNLANSLGRPAALSGKPCRYTIRYWPVNPTTPTLTGTGGWFCCCWVIWKKGLTIINGGCRCRSSCPGFSGVPTNRCGMATSSPVSVS